MWWHTFRSARSIQLCVRFTTLGLSAISFYNWPFFNCMYAYFALSFQIAVNSLFSLELPVFSAKTDPFCVGCIVGNGGLKLPTLILSQPFCQWKGPEWVDVIGVKTYESIKIRAFVLVVILTQLYFTCFVLPEDYWKHNKYKKTVSRKCDHKLTMPSLVGRVENGMLGYMLLYCPL